MKERAAAIVIGLLMVFSMVGYAAISVIPSGDGDNQQGTEVSVIINRALSPTERIEILRAGKVVMEATNSEECLEDCLIECSQCQEEMAALEGFARQYSSYLVLSESVGDFEVRMIGRGGRIFEVENITQIFDVFCEASIVTPRDCVLSGI